MKKIILIFLTLLMIFTVGCNKSPDKRDESSYVRVTYCQGGRGTPYELSEDDANYVSLILNSDRWKPQISKDIYDYIFEWSGLEIRYVSGLGLFNDPTNDRHLYVTEEQRIHINSMINSLSK